MRLLCLVAILLAPTVALANGAMGLGLEMFDPTYWWAYVAAMVLGEAWLIGRGLGRSWTESLVISVVANLVSGLCGIAGCAAPFFHYPVIGVMNPFLNAIALMCLFAIPSALVEAIVWQYGLRYFGRLKDPSGEVQPIKDGRLAGRSLWVHFALVPVALAILLIPNRPYKGMEAWGVSRFSLYKVERALNVFTSEHGRVPSAATAEQLISQLKPFAEADLESAFVEPDFSRFSTGKVSMPEWEINPQLIGKKPEENSVDTWYLRLKNTQSQYPRGIYMSESGYFKLARLAEHLGR